MGHIKTELANIAVLHYWRNISIKDDNMRIWNLELGSPEEADQFSAELFIFNFLIFEMSRFLV